MEILRGFAAFKESIGRNDALERDLGLDSLNKIEVLVKMEEDLKVSFPAGFMSDIQTVGELIDRTQKIIKVETVLGGHKESVKDILSSPPEEKERDAFRKRGSLFYKACEFALFLATKLSASLFYKIHPKFEADFPSGAFIIAANHNSYMDAYVISSVMPWKIKSRLYFLGAAPLFEGRLLRLFKAPSGVLSFDFADEPLKVLKMAVYALKEGNAVCIFPEGGRSYDGKLQSLKKGTGIIAEAAKIPVYPAFISGTFESWPRFIKIPRIFKKINLVVGAPLYLDDISDNPHKDFLENLKNRILDLGKLVEKDA